MHRLGHCLSLSTSTLVAAHFQDKSAMEKLDASLEVELNELKVWQRVLHQEQREQDLRRQYKMTPATELWEEKKNLETISRVF